MREARATIDRIRVTSDGFLLPFTLDLSSGLNCVIGARGTGKTSILELIRWAVGREGDVEGRGGTLPDIVEAALGVDGRVFLDVTMPLGEKLTFERGSSGQPEAVDQSDGAPVNINWPPLNAYDLSLFSQNQLEDVATDPVARLQMLDSFCGDSIRRIQERISGLARRLRDNGQRILELTNAIEEYRLQLEAIPGVEAELATIEAAYTQATHALEASPADKERVADLAETRVHLGQEKTALAGLLDDAELALLESFPGQHLGNHLRDALSEDEVAPLPGRDRLRILRARVAEQASSFAALRADMRARLSAIRDLIRDASIEADSQWKAVDAEYHDQAGKLAALNAEWKQCANQRDALLERLGRLKAARLENERRESLRQQLQQERSELLSSLAGERHRRYEVRAAAAMGLNEAIGGAVRVDLIESGDPERYRSYLLGAFRGSNLWYTKMVDAMASTVPPDELARLARTADDHALARTLNIEAGRAARALKHLADFQTAQDLETLDVEDCVNFSLQVDGGSYRDTDDISQGQKCTTVLSILLVDSTSPLIIDQPEDNLDNAYIVSSVVNVVRAQAAQRQFIFVTHNPNIPVIGEAANVVVMGSVDGRGSTLTAGKWNEPSITRSILTIMEGGADAFALRTSAYRLSDEVESVAGS
jgi:ABC-type cobalamin/Fe3+-siderophores transport system ATPase subunit